MSDAGRNYIAAMNSAAAEGGSDTTESVGSALRRAREKRGLTLAHVSRDLCLKEDVLRALESRQYSALPKVPYCFGFVRTYARHLGLEPEEMVQRFKGEIGDVPQETKLVPPQPLRAGRLPGRAAVTFSILIAAAVYGGWYFYMGRQEAFTVPAVSADAGSPMAPVPLLDDATALKLNAEVDKKAAEAERETLAATTSAKPPAPEKVEIVLKALGPCWVYVHDQHGKAVFHKTMRRGEVFKIPEPHPDLVVDLGNPAAMQISYNGRVLKALGSQGQASRISLDPKELAKRP
ncbi:MAG: helix-turn-helix domain-containing protein [Rhodospirillaceae bacterium]|nr:helix-turn-helix domain-containing protein [Rhodospirillaceae bacterium]